MTGATLKAFRERMNFSQSKLAEALGVTRRTIATYEAGADKPVPRVVALACAAIVYGAPPLP